MTGRILLAAVVAMFAAGTFGAPALAGHCPKDVRLIDQSLKTARISDANMTTVKALRDKGDGQHKAGQHGASLATLHEAMKILDVSH